MQFGGRTSITVASVLAALGILIAERHRPLRRRTRAALPRDLRNATMGAMSAAVVAMVETPVTQWIARGNVARRHGLAQHLPRPLGPVAAFLAMDYGFYLWHVATHRLTLLWRFHRVHHVDPDMDMSTAIRFHLMDMLVSLPWRMVQVRASGIGPRTLEAWQGFFTVSILFHHSNLQLPREWDRRLSWLLTTPCMHGIHHSVISAQHDSNWSSGLSVWDRLHRTLVQDVPQDTLTIGIDDPAALTDVPLGGALLAPFRPMPSVDRHA